MQKLAQVDIGRQFFQQGVSGPHFLSLTGISDIVSLFLNIVFVLSGIILLFYFILGGIGMIASAGESDPQKAEGAKKTITSAVIGFVVVFASYWIVKLVSQLLGVPDLIF